MTNTIAIIMGSGVLPDGSPSTGMRRRVTAALQLRDEFNDLVFIPTGGIAPGCPCSEADAMKDLLLQAGVKSDCIIPETRAKNTLQNVIYSAHIIKKLPLSGAAIVCSVNFHILRCRMLLSIMGISTTSRPMPPVSKHIRWIRRAYFYCREAVAIPVDTITLLVLKAFRKA